MFDKARDCCICRRPVQGYGNNAWPIKHGRCCNDCNLYLVIPERIERIHAAIDAGEPSCSISTFLARSRYHRPR